MRGLLKRLISGLARLIVFPAACLAGFGRWEEPFLFFAQMFALAPGLPGSYLRVAYYRFTLDRGVGPDCYIAMGAYFAHPTASLGPKTGIGAYSILGSVDIGQGTLLGGHVQVLSGTRQHVRDDSGHLTDTGRTFRRISIGPHCWIGAGAIIAADVGEKATVGAHSVVSQDVAPGDSVLGNPARKFFPPVKSDK